MDNLEHGESVVETESNCSYEETAAKIEKVLRRNLRLDMVDASDDKTTHTPRCRSLLLRLSNGCSMELAIIEPIYVAGEYTLSIELHGGLVKCR